LASDQINENKEIFGAAVRTTPTALRFVSAKIMRVGGIRKEAGKEDRDQQAHTHGEQAMLSGGFINTDYATNFVVLLKRNEYLRNFTPDAWRKSCCGPDFQNISSDSSLRIYSISLKRDPAVRGNLPSKAAGIFLSGSTWSMNSRQHGAS